MIIDLILPLQIKMILRCLHKKTSRVVYMCEHWTLIRYVSAILQSKLESISKATKLFWWHQNQRIAASLWYIISKTLQAFTATKGIYSERDRRDSRRWRSSCRKKTKNQQSKLGHYPAPRKYISAEENKRVPTAEEAAIKDAEGQKRQKRAPTQRHGPDD